MDILNSYIVVILASEAASRRRARPESIVLKINSNAYMNKGGFVYIMANDRPTLYTGVTSNLLKRMYEHKNNIIPKSFTSQYKVHKLVYYEFLSTINEAIIREKQIKDMNRVDKMIMINKFNPGFKDLFDKIKNEITTAI